jgi:hypothetical protein
LSAVAAAVLGAPRARADSPAIGTRSRVGMMDPAYFASKKTILDWLNSAYQMRIDKIEETASGASVGRSTACFNSQYEYHAEKQFYFSSLISVQSAVQISTNIAAISK